MINREEISKDVDELFAGWFNGHYVEADKTDIIELVMKHCAKAATIGLSAMKPPIATHRHKKRGTEYLLLGIGKMQAEAWFDHDNLSSPSVDHREVAIYRSVDDWSLWARPREEFEDGRFEPLASLLPTVWIMRTRDGGFYPIQPSDKCRPEDHGKLNGHVVVIEDLAGEVIWRREENAE